MADGFIHRERPAGTARKISRKKCAAPPATLLPDRVDSAARESETPDKSFIEALYLALNPDVAAAIRAGEFANGWAHWTKFGRQETQKGDRPALQKDSYYAKPLHKPAAPLTEYLTLDPEAYLYLNPDVRGAAGADLNAARQHWLKHGRFESRLAPGVAPFRRRNIDFGRMSARPFGLNVFGPFMAKTGLGTACRNMLAAIKATHLDFDVWNFDTSEGPARFAEIDRNRQPRFNTNIIFSNADQMENVFFGCPEGFFDDAYTIAVWQWELAAFRPEWFSAFGAVDEIWTNSRFQADAISAVSPVPVTQIHLPIITENSASTLSRADLGIKPDVYVFLLPFDIGSTVARKNPLAGIAAFKKAFGRREDVALIVKYQAPEHDREFGLVLRRLTAGFSNIRLIEERLDESEMAGLRHLSNALLSTHRSEGFGLNIGAFMALGKTVIATNYSGNTDFFDATTGYPVDYKLTEIGKMTGPDPSGYIWAEPDDVSLVQQMRAAVENPTEAVKRGELAAKRIAETCSVERIAWDIIARLRTIELDQKLPSYARWIGHTSGIRSPSPLRPFGEGANRAVPALQTTPLFSVIMPVYNVEARLLERSIQSVINQSYPFWELCIANDASTAPDTLATLNRYRGVSPRLKICDLPVNTGAASASNRAVNLAAGAYVAMLDSGDELETEALTEIATAINLDPLLDCLYTDGTEIAHFFKADWSPEHLESVMCVLHMLVVRKKLFLEVGQFRPEYDGAQDYDLMLRISRKTVRIRHVLKALYQRRAIPGSAAATVDARPRVLEAGLRALTDHVTHKFGAAARAEHGPLTGTLRVRRNINTTPPVSLMILTSNLSRELAGRGKVNLVENFVDSIRRLTQYPNFRIAVVDNSSLQKSQIEKFEAAGAQVLNYKKIKPCNYAAKANFAVRSSQTELMVLLHDDMEVINPDWLGALLEYVQDPEIGAVGARLLRADGSLQYASAVTSACLATRKQVVMHAGGFDECFASGFNDIDLFFRIRQAGYRVVQTSLSELYHFGGQTIARTAYAKSEHEREMLSSRRPDVMAAGPVPQHQPHPSGLNFTCG